MKINLTLPILFFLFTFLTASAQNILRINNPEWGDIQGYPGSITEATFTIKPQGAYMAIDMFLTFRDTELYFYPGDSTEIVLDFNLPEGAIVNDSWLWMMDDTTIVKADIHDIWSATATYDDIVDRRQDPSLLYRKESGTYQIRVYPLPYDETRRVKISFLSPTVWSAEEVQAWLPIEILQTSEIPLNSFRLITFPSDTWQHPNLKGVPDITFQSTTDPNYGDVLVADIPIVHINKPLTFAVDAPFNDDGIFVQKLTDGTDKFYQAAFLPPELLLPSNPKKLVFLIDHKAENSAIDTDDLYEYLEEQCQTYLQTDDLFNFSFSTPMGPEMLSDDWIEGDSLSIQQMFGQVASPIQNYSNILDLINNGIDFLMENGEEGDLVLIANSDEIYWNNSQEVEDIKIRLAATNIKIHIINYQSENFYYEWVWNGPDFWTYHNFRFYHDITLQTGGHMFGSLEGAGNVWANIPSLFNSIKSSNYNFDLHSSLSNGFTFNRFHQNYLGQSQNINQPILQIGKYTGDFPFELDYSAEVDGNIITENITVPTTEIVEGDSLNREIWIGHQLRNMESLATGTSGIQAIIDLSIEERVLSDYTAFLALDLVQGGEPCIGCWEFDDWIFISTEDLYKESDIKITAFPNPSSDYFTIEINLENGLSVEEATLSIFDAYGKQVIEKDLEELTRFGKMQWTWDGKSANSQALPSGMYYMILKTEKGTKTTKLTLIK